MREIKKKLIIEEFFVAGSVFEASINTLTYNTNYEKYANEVLNFDFGSAMSSETR